MKLQELCTRHIRKLTRAIKRANVIYESEQSPTRLKREMVHVFRIASTAKTLLCAIMQNKSGADLRLGAHTRAAYFFPNHWRTFRAAGVRYSTTNDFLRKPAIGGGSGDGSVHKLPASSGADGSGGANAKMSRTILIYGQSGSGKTTSCRNLDPATTFFIDSDGKGLSWRGWRKQYNADHKNYIRTDEVDPHVKTSVPNILRAVALNEKYAHIKTVVVDGISTLMVTDEFRRRKEKGFDKYQDLAACIFETVKQAAAYRDDLTVVFIGHVDVERDTGGAEIFSQVRTSGQKLKRIVLESLFTTVLYAKTEGGEYYFETRPNKSTAKAPFGALPDVLENDIAEVIRLLIAYEEGEDETAQEL